MVLAAALRTVRRSARPQSTCVVSERPLPAGQPVWGGVHALDPAWALSQSDIRVNHFSSLAGLSMKGGA